MPEASPSEFRPKTRATGMTSGWPDEQDWESLSAAVRAEADAAIIEEPPSTEWYQKGERSFCEFVHDMARKHSSTQVSIF